MSDELEYRCFIGNLSWTTSDRNLKDAFNKFGHLSEAKAQTRIPRELAKAIKNSLIALDSKTVAKAKALKKVVFDKFSGRSRGFGFVTFDEKKAMEDAIEAMNGIDLDGRPITVDKAQPNTSSGRDSDSYRDRDHDRNRDYGGGRGSNGGDCFKCGKPGHFARECPSEGGRSGGRYGGRDDRYGSRDDRYGGGGGGGGGSGGSGGGGSRYGPSRTGDRFGGRNKDGNRGGSGGDRYNRDRSGPYERRGA